MIELPSLKVYPFPLKVAFTIVLYVFVFPWATFIDFICMNCTLVLKCNNQCQCGPLNKKCFSFIESSFAVKEIKTENTFGYLWSLVILSLF